MSKRFIVLSNWKMHKTLREALAWIAALDQAASGISQDLELIVCVPFTVLRATADAIQNSRNIAVGAQNVHWETAGAYTGEISAAMIADAGGRYCVVGHSERRQYFAETDEIVNRKIRELFKHNIAPIVCIGESLEQRQRGLTLNQLERQFITCFASVTADQMPTAVILYEPVWSIGTGHNATPQQAEEAHGFIRELLTRHFSEQAASATRIMYGGSVKDYNVAAMVSAKGIDGIGAGSGSLDVSKFIAIAEICSRVLDTGDKEK